MSACVSAEAAAGGAASRRAALLLSVLVLGIATPSAASAQSLLQSIFGFLGGDQPKPSGSFRRAQPLPAAGPAGLAPLGQAPYALRPLTSLRQPSLPDTEASESRRDGTRYRSLCVRTCDGFYFPVSYGVTRSALYDDQKRCEAGCGGQGKLYFYPVKGGDIADMVDFTGRNYSELPNAFRYRKALVSGCSCRPAPWSAAERARHARYAQAEAAEVRQDAARDDETADASEGVALVDVALPVRKKATLARAAVPALAAEDEPAGVSRPGIVELTLDEIPSRSAAIPDDATTGTRPAIAAPPTTEGTIAAITPPSATRQPPPVITPAPAKHPVAVPTAEKAHVTVAGKAAPATAGIAGSAPAAPVVPSSAAPRMTVQTLAPRSAESAVIVTSAPLDDTFRRTPGRPTGR